MNAINKFSLGNGDKLSCLSGSLLNGFEFVLVATRKIFESEMFSSCLVLVFC